MRTRGMRYGIAVLLFLACTTTPTARKKPMAAAPFPTWADDLQAARDAQLEEVASFLCARGTDAVIDNEARRVNHLVDGQVFGIMERRAQAASRALRRAAALHHPTHAGVVTIGDCHAAVMSRKSVVIENAPFVASMGDTVDLVVDSTLPYVVYLALPSGRVKRFSAEAVLRFPTEGRYRAEVITLDPLRGPSVAALWPIDVGEAIEASIPEVLFPDDGLSDLALTRRLDALTHRLRTEMELPTLRLAPPLESLAGQRASALAAARHLGHHVPDGSDAFTALSSSSPGYKVARLSELQAQGATLKDAWFALLASPAHRYELTQTSLSHIGTAVRQGVDEEGRPLISVVVLLARRISEVNVRRAKANTLMRYQLARQQRRLPKLKVDTLLSEVAQGCAEAMAEQRRAADDVLGRPVAEVALQGGRHEVVRSVVAALDDPSRLPPSRATLDPAAKEIGIGMVSGQVAGQWYICVLAGR